MPLIIHDEDQINLIIMALADRKDLFEAGAKTFPSCTKIMEEYVKKIDTLLEYINSSRA